MYVSFYISIIIIISKIIKRLGVSRTYRSGICMFPFISVLSYIRNNQPFWASDTISLLLTPIIPPPLCKDASILLQPCEMRIFHYLWNEPRLEGRLASHHLIIPAAEHTLWKKVSRMIRPIWLCLRRDCKAMAPPLLISPWRCRINFLPQQASLASEVTAMGPTHFLLLCLFALVMPVLVVDISTPQQQPDISERFLKIAFLGPSMKSMPWVYYGSVELSGPAISLAVEEFTSRGWLGGMNVR